MSKNFNIFIEMAIFFFLKFKRKNYTFLPHEHESEYNIFLNTCVLLSNKFTFSRHVYVPSTIQKKQYKKIYLEVYTSKDKTNEKRCDLGRNFRMDCLRPLPTVQVFSRQVENLSILFCFPSHDSQLQEIFNPTRLR